MNLTSPIYQIFFTHWNILSTLLPEDLDELGVLVDDGLVHLFGVNEAEVDVSLNFFYEYLR